MQIFNQNLSEICLTHVDDRGTIKEKSPFGVEYTVGLKHKMSLDITLLSKIAQINVIHNENQLFKESVLKSLNCGNMGRYFTVDPFFFCRSCGCLGHIAEDCSLVKDTQCLICLGDHPKRCKSIACYHCHDKGHTKKDCKRRNNVIRGWQSLLDMSPEFEDISCLVCGQQGHVNCSYSEQQDDIYDSILILQ